ncbi:S1C family serine protease [Streptomyces sp. G1]|uniref:S1C family serine protease n=1 Tax=Streptomyces sp. G1 TaxID=361572 RepID=UPI0020303EDD|nr:S1C family serine protease [Streptomyces sp. G1]MCM1973726.1 S1C family serine protease [Streptomyces sp. G1]
MSNHINLLAASTLLIAMCGANEATAREPSPGNHEQAEAAVVQVLGDIASGTGFIYDADKGLVVTTAYITAGQSNLQVLVAGRPAAPAELLGSDLCQDLAVLQLTAPQAGLEALQFGDSDKVFDGDAVTSLSYPDAGAPGADVVAVTSEADEEPGGKIIRPSIPDYPSLIYHSAATKTADTGGPLLNRAGQVIGVNTGVSIEGMQVSAAISSDQATEELPGLAAGAQKNDPGWWINAVSDRNFVQNAAGVGLDKGASQAAQKRLQDAGTDGLFVMNVRKDSPASHARVQQGAVITKVNGEGVPSFPDLCNTLEDASPGDTLTVEGVYSGVGAAGRTFGEAWTANLVLAGDS